MWRRARRPDYSTAIASRRPAISHRGSLSVWLDVDRPDPENRNVIHSDPVGWTLAHRGKILRALYTILLGNPRFAGGEQEPEKTRFRRWWHLVGAALEHAAGLLGGGAGYISAGPWKPAHKLAEPLDFVEQFRVFEDNDDQGNALAGLLRPARRRYGRARLSRRVPRRPGRQPDAGQRAGLDDIAQELRGLLDYVGMRPLGRGHRTFCRQSAAAGADNPAIAGSEVLILRKRANPGGGHLPGLYLIERRRQP